MFDPTFKLPSTLRDTAASPIIFFMISLPHSLKSWPSPSHTLWPNQTPLPWEHPCGVRTRSVASRSRAAVRQVMQQSNRRSTQAEFENRLYTDSFHQSKFQVDKDAVIPFITESFGYIHPAAVKLMRYLAPMIFDKVLAP